MSEAWVLSLASRYPHRAALARRARDGAVFFVLQRLEARGLVRRGRDRYQLTKLGRDELAVTVALTRLALR
jgi:DNA-binding PadR family transcriptional regulator